MIVPLPLHPPFACYEHWLQHREDLDIGYVLANSSIFWQIHLLHDFVLQKSFSKVFTITIPICVYGLADVMVPPLECSEYMYVLQNIVENIVRERCEHSIIHPPGHSGHEHDERGEV